MRLGITLAAALVAAPAMAFVATEPAPRSAIVHVTVDNKATYADGTGGCTAYHVGKGRFATAGHCVESQLNKTLFLLFSDGSRSIGRLAYFTNRFLGFDDAALIAITEYELNKAPLETLDMDCGPVPPIGAEVRMTGFPGAIGPMTVWGRVSTAPFITDKALKWTTPLLGVNIAAANGYSGSPIIDDTTGKVIGTLAGAVVEQPTHAWAVPAAWICKVLN